MKRVLNFSLFLVVILSMFVSAAATSQIVPTQTAAIGQICLKNDGSSVIKCVTQMAVKEKNDSVCMKIKDLVKKAPFGYATIDYAVDKCRLEVGAKNPSKITCENIIDSKLKDRCYYSLMECDNVKNDYNRGWCFIELSVAKRNDSDCMKIPERTDLLRTCISKVSRAKMYDVLYAKRYEILFGLPAAGYESLSKITKLASAKIACNLLKKCPTVI